MRDFYTIVVCDNTVLKINSNIVHMIHNLVLAWFPVSAQHLYPYVDVCVLGIARDIVQIGFSKKFER